MAYSLEKLVSNLDGKGFRNTSNLFMEGSLIYLPEKEYIRIFIWIHLKD